MTACDLLSLCVATVLLPLVLAALLARLALQVLQVLQVLALVDAVRRPEAHLAAQGGKTRWVALLAVSLVVPGGGVLLAVVYLVGVRPRVRVS